MVQINMREMLEAGVHFGHQVRRWNPKMKPFIFGKKNGIYIIDLQTSIEMFKAALQFISDQVVAGRDALIVGTKKQAQSIIEEIAEETGMHYVNKRWLGGLLTNFSMIKKSIDRLLELDEMKKDGRWEVKSKKEQSRLEKVYKKLYRSLWGIRRMTSLPGVVIVIDSTFEDIAINEAKRMNIPIVAVVDTNANPEDVPFPVPGNDDAVVEGRNRKIQESANAQQLAAEKAAAEAAAAAEGDTAGDEAAGDALVTEKEN
jgi:small subunit ribosomal protein S2